MTPTSDDPLLGRVLERRYEIVESLARGGMATVYRAVDLRLDREVAVKVIHPHLAQDPTFVDRFQREARAAARLSHPNIVTVHDHSHDDDIVFLVMEYVPGATVREVIAAEGPFTPRKALNVMAPVLEALAAAHAAGIVHRDIKPENVIIRSDGRVKVTDFGLARAVTSDTVTSTGQILGTVAYLAPELVTTGTSSPRVDVYAAGLLLFEMLTATKAFGGETAISVAWQHVNQGVPPVSTRADGIPPSLDGLVQRATAIDPAQRPADGAAFLALARQVRTGLTAEQLDRVPVPLPGSGPDAAASAAVGYPDPTPALPVAEVARVATEPTQALPRDLVPVTTAPVARRSAGRWLLPLLLLALLGGGAAWYFLAGPGAVVTIPVTTGQNPQRAAQILTAAELGSTQGQAFSETIAKGTVVGTDPAAGQEVRKGSTVTILVSRGPERYAVPDLAGQTRDQAEALLGQQHLAVGGVTEAFDETIAQGQVIATDPKAGTPLKKGESVALVISKGRQPIELTLWEGKPAKDAIAALTKAGLTVDSTQREFSDTVPEGSVIGQEPKSGTLHKGDKVTLVLSKGPELVDVPSVLGKQVDEATATLKAAGFEVRVEWLLPGLRFGTVQSQDPSGGKARKGSTITLGAV